MKKPSVQFCEWNMAVKWVNSNYHGVKQANRELNIVEQTDQRELTTATVN